MTYAVVVAQVRLEGALTELHVLAVHRDLELEDGMRLLGQRPEGTVAHLRRLPVDDLPAPGEVLRLEPAKPRHGQVAPADNSVAARRERRQQALGGKA
jgi:hypothetical protein